jgi:hypothetical protein
MLCVEEEEYYYLIFGGKEKTKWLADECVKKCFLDALLEWKKELEFRVYAYCLLDEEAHLLLGTGGRKETHLIEKRGKEELQTLYIGRNPKGRERITASCRKMPVRGLGGLLDQCCQIHLLAAPYAGKLQDYWWSSYAEYVGLLKALDQDMHRAQQKFTRYHKKFDFPQEDAS